MKRSIRAAYPLASAFALIATPLAAHDRAPMQASDLVTMPRLGSPSVSPDGTMAVYPVTSTDDETLERSSQLYVRSIADDDAQPVALDLKAGGAPTGSRSQ